MLGLEDQHGPQPNGALAGTSDVDAHALGLLEDLVPPGAVPRDEGALSPTTEVLNFLGEPLGQPLQATVQIGTGVGRVPDEIQTLNLPDDGTEQDGARRVAHPRVELTVRLVRSEFVVAKVVARGLGLLGEGDHVRGRLEAPVLVGPELARGTDAGLHFVDDEEDVVLFGELAEAAEEGW